MVYFNIGKNVGKCADNKFRICKVFRFGFVYEECTFSFLFLLDKNLNVLVTIEQASLIKK